LYSSLRTLIDNQKEFDTQELNNKNDRDVLNSLVTTPATAVQVGAIISWGRGQFFTTIQLTSGSVLVVRR
jgi:hypothetical protein